jgi:hypothetical protein
MTPIVKCKAVYTEFKLIIELTIRFLFVLTIELTIGAVTISKAAGFLFVLTKSKITFGFSLFAVNALENLTWFKKNNIL